MNTQRKQHILLFCPKPVSGWHVYHRRVIPLSLLHLAAPLDRKGYRVRIIDQFADPHWKKKLVQALDDNPLCFGVTSMTGPQIRHGVQVSKFVKSRHPDLPVVWGGIHASILPEQTLENPYVDLVVVGEGEATFPELVEALETRGPLEQIKGLAYKEGGQVHFTGDRPFVDINEQSMPPYHLVDMQQYDERILGIAHVHFIGSRGCVHQCAFCWDPVMHKRRFRAMDADRVLDQMTHVIRQHGIRGFIFADDDFFINMNRACSLLEKIVQSDLDICIGKLFIRADTVCEIDGDFLDLMVRAGVKRLVIGAESGSPRVLELMKKGITVEQIIEANRKLVPYAIRPAFLFMMGLPTETPEEVAQSVRLADQVLQENPRATRSFNIYTPFPGTELFGRAVELGLKEPERLEDWARYTYRYLPDESPWILPETKRLVALLDYALMTHDQDNSLGVIKKADPISVWLAKVYKPLARYRVKTLDTRLPIEPKLIKAAKWIIGRD